MLTPPIEHRDKEMAHLELVDANGSATGGGGPTTEIELVEDDLEEVALIVSVGEQLKDYSAADGRLRASEGSVCTHRY